MVKILCDSEEISLKVEKMIQINEKTLKVFSFLNRLTVFSYLFLIVVLWTYTRDIVLLLLVTVPSAFFVGVVATLLLLLKIVYKTLGDKGITQLDAVDI